MIQLFAGNVTNITVFAVNIVVTITFNTYSLFQIFIPTLSEHF